MKKIITLCLFLAILCPGLSFAQVSLYTYSPSVGTYTPITGTAATVTNLDEGLTGLLPIGFSFWYDGATYTSLSASTNGAVKLGGVMTTSSDPNYKNLGFSTQRPMLAVLTDNLALTASDGIRYETSGTAPSRVFTLQWSGVKWGKDATSAGIEFQVKLYESSNRIEYVYNQLSGALSFPYATVGISTLATGFDSYMTVVSASSPSGVSFTQSTGGHTGKPVTGQVYAFTPPVLCTTPPEAGTALASVERICAGYNFTLSVNNTPTTHGLSFQWQSSADGVNWQNIAGASTTSHTLMQTATTYYRRAITCSGTTAYSVPVLVTQGGGAPVYAAVPYTQNFEGTWISNCATRDLPPASWSNSVPMGNRSWRREDDGASAGWENTNGWNGGSSSHAARFHVRDENTRSEPRYGNLDLYVDCSTPGNKELRFRHIQSSYYSSLGVYYSTDGGANFTLLGKIAGINQWLAHQFRLPSTSATTVVRFQGEGQAYSGGSDIGLDDVQVLNVACTYPTGINFTAVQQTSATANWGTIDGVLGYEYAVTTSPHPPTTGITSTTAASVAVSGLTAATSYYLHVRARCNATEYSSWASQMFTTSVDCSTAPSITCGTPVTVNFDYGYGKYDLYQSDPGGHCGSNALGVEKMFRFTPAVTGVYSLKVSATTADYSVYYYLKDAAGGCAPMGWTCLGSTYDPKTFTLGTLTAGKEYFIMLDLFTIVNAHTETLEIICPAANTDCVSAGLTPAAAVICPGGSVQLATNGGTVYQWYKDGVAINGATAATYAATQPGTYRVAITNGTCTAAATNASVLTVAAVPMVTATGATSFCQGGSVVLSTTAADSYQWYKDGVLLQTANQQTYTVTESGAYTVRLTREGCLSEPSAAQNVTVHALPAVPVVTAVGSTSVCAGDLVTLTTASVPGYTYLWQRNGVDASSSSSHEFSFLGTTGGAFTVKVTNVNGCAASSVPINITVNEKPAVPVITAAGATTFCQGGSVVLQSSATTGNQWYRDGQAIPNAQGATYTVTADGLYRVFATIGSCSTGSEGQRVIVKVIPSVAIDAAGPTTFCAGGSVLLRASADVDNNNTYQWQLDGTAIANATTASYTATASGRYTVAVSSIGCTGSSPAKEVAATPLPAKPVISQVGNTLSASGSGTFQWYLNGVAITGATAAQHTATVSGQYTVLVTQGGCSTLSEVFNFVTTGLVQPGAWNNDVTVFPNPVQDYVRISNSSQRKLQVQLTDVSGRVIYKGSVHSASGSITTKKLAPGSYWLIITDQKKGETIVKAFIKH